MNNFPHELAECAGYYGLSAVAPGVDDATKERLNDVSVALMAGSAKFSTEKLAVARVELAMKSMMREMDNDWGNFSILLNKYALPCKDAAEDPAGRMQYWLDKTD